MRGPNITWGYWRRLDQTRAAIDEEGFFKLGDSLRFADDGDPSKGFIFDGRIEGWEGTGALKLEIEKWKFEI